MTTLTEATVDLFASAMDDQVVRDALAHASWISPAEPVVARPGRRPAQLVRGQFHAAPGTRAWVFATAHGIYELFLNGTRVGDIELTPGFSAYRKRLEVQRYDITELLAPGENTLVAVLSDGWFRGRHGFERRADGFGTRTAFLASVVDQTGAALAGTGITWRSRPSHIWRADLMDGQAADLRDLDPTWFTGGDEAGWSPVTTSEEDPLCADRGRLVAPVAPDVRRIEELPPVTIARPRRGTVVLDFGQNINGWVRVADCGPAGTHLVLSHGETLDQAGLVTTQHLRAFNFASHELLPAGQVDEVISAGRPGEVFEPRHTTHGFRYLQVDRVPEGLDWAGTRAIVVRSDLPRTGEFGCSDERLTRLHEVVRWSLQDNTCGVPTDCPQRERSGFTGDWQIFVATAALMVDVNTFSRRWLRDLAADQWPDGRIPTIVPNPAGNGPSGIAFEDASAGSAGWGDAAAIVPWELWRAYGERDALTEALPAMRHWVTYAATCAASHRHPGRAAARPIPAGHERYLWDTGFHFGEWLEPDVPPAPDAAVDHGIVATAYLHRSAEITAAAARILELHDVAAEFQTIADGARAAWQAEYLLPNGHLREERQAHYVRALAFGLVPGHLRQLAADRLAELIWANDDRLNTGFLATGMLLPALADNGHADLAWRLLTRKGQPSWLGMLDAGATTMWEHWDGIAPDGTVTGSLNHYSKGAVTSFLHTHIAGLQLPEFPDAAQAGYRSIRISPHVFPGLTSAATRQQTVAGPIAVSWHLEGPTFALELELPACIAAEVDLPDGRCCRVRGGSTRITCPLPSSPSRTGQEVEHS